MALAPSQRESAAVPCVHGRPIFVPSVTATTAVGVGLLLCGPLVLSTAGLVPIGLSSRVRTAVSAALALVLLWSGFAFLRSRITESVAGLATTADARFLGGSEALLLVGAGCLVGGLAGVVATRSAR